MKNYADDLAIELKNRNNKKAIGNVIGTVLSTSPLRVGILSNAATLDNSNCYICTGITGLVNGSKVLVICDDVEETFYIINKIAKVV